MTWHVIAVAGIGDKYKVKLRKGDEDLIVPFSIPGHLDSIESSLPFSFSDYSFSPSVEAEDLLNFAITAYAADVRISRDTAFDGWTRDICLHIPVHNVEKWLPVVNLMQELLSFLTGDHWTINLREIHKSFKSIIPSPKNEERIVLKNPEVSLFSGGLDSFVGALDLLSNSKRPVVLLGHHGKGGGPTSVAQAEAINTIRLGYSEEIAPFFKLWVSIPKGETRSSEITTRGRSILFISLGIFVASGFSAKKFYIPENGVISLNVPLTNSRLGSFSTRTTHPYYVFLLRNIIKAIGLEIEVILPYRFKTKGEMVAECLDQKLIRVGMKTTMSCSHPGVGHWKLNGNPNQHCGYCVPCIIRRASLKSLKRDTTSYGNKIDKSLSPVRGADVKAFRMALARYSVNPPSIKQILMSGPLPVSDEEKEQFLSVYKRGIEEIRKVIK
jgi:hypothetical protein